MDPYAVLKVRRNATIATIEKAFRKLAFKTHPDRGGDHKKFAEIQKAWFILSDEKRKAEYDATGELPRMEVDQSGARCNEMLVKAFITAMSAMASHAKDPGLFSPIKVMREFLQTQIGMLQIKYNDTVPIERLLKATLDRFVDDCGTMFGIIQGQMAQLERDKRLMFEDIQAMKAALKYLDTVGYRLDNMDPKNGSLRSFTRSDQYRFVLG